MAQDVTAIYPLASGMQSGVTMGGYSGMASMGFGPQSATPTTMLSGLSASGGLSSGILPFVFWTVVFLGGGLVLLHWER